MIMRLDRLQAEIPPPSDSYPEGAPAYDLPPQPAAFAPTGEVGNER